MTAQDPEKPLLTFPCEFPMKVMGRREDGFAFEVEMIAVCLRQGWPIAWAPIRTIYGDERSHIRPLHHLREFLAVTRRARRIALRGAVERDPRGGPGGPA